MLCAVITRETRPGFAKRSNTSKRRPWLPSCSTVVTGGGCCHLFFVVMNRCCDEICIMARKRIDRALLLRHLRDHKWWSLCNSFARVDLPCRSPRSEHSSTMIVALGKFTRDGTWSQDLPGLLRKRQLCWLVVRTEEVSHLERSVEYLACMS